MMKIDIGIIPARSGSKGLPGKNLKKVGGKSLIFRAVEGCLKSNVIDKIIFSSDSENYAQHIKDNLSKNDLKKILFHHRSDKHSQDKSEVDPMLVSMIKEIYKDNQPVTAGLFYPTSPLRNSNHIKDAVKIFHKQNCDSLLSVERFTDYIWKEDNEKIYPLNYNPENRVSRQIQQVNYFKENKSIYLFYVKNLINNGYRLTKNPHYFIMDSNDSVDVDDLFDLQLANLYVK